MPNVYQISTKIDLHQKKRWLDPKKIGWGETWMRQRKAEFQALPVGTQILIGAAAGPALLAGAIAAAPLEAAALTSAGFVAAGIAAAVWPARPGLVKTVENLGNLCITL